MSFLKLFIPSKKKGLTEDEVENLIQLTRQAQQGLNDGGRVSYASLKSVPFARSEADALVVNEGVRCFHLELNDEDLSVWDTHMDPNSQFGLHDHDVPEQIWVLDGYCTVDGRKMGRFETRRFNKEKEHDVKSKPGCRLLVIFRETKK